MNCLSPFSSAHFHFIFWGALLLDYTNFYNYCISLINQSFYCFKLSPPNIFFVLKSTLFNNSMATPAILWLLFLLYVFQYLKVIRMSHVSINMRMLCVILLYFFQTCYILFISMIVIPPESKRRTLLKVANSCKLSYLCTVL